MIFKAKVIKRGAFYLTFIKTKNKKRSRAWNSPRNFLDVQVCTQPFSQLPIFVRLAYQRVSCWCFRPRSDLSPWFVGVLLGRLPASFPWPGIFDIYSTGNDSFAVCRLCKTFLLCTRTRDPCGPYVWKILYNLRNCNFKKIVKSSLQFFFFNFLKMQILLLTRKNPRDA